MAADRSEALRAAHAAGGPLVVPLAHDAFSARLIEAAGFPAFNIGGSTLLAARYALPDLGIGALGEMSAAIKDILDATGLPCMADADDGYGDLKGVARTIRTYERIGVAGLLLEDQAREGKRPGAQAATAVISPEAMVERLKTAQGSRSTGLVIIGRTDALGLEGIDGALRRGEQYLKAGADGVFVAGLKTVEQYERVGAAFKGQWNMAAVFEGGLTPWLTPQAMHGLGFSQVAYPMLLMQRLAGVIEQTLTSLAAFARGERSDVALAELLSPSGFRTAVELERWLAIEKGGKA